MVMVGATSVGRAARAGRVRRAVSWGALGLGVLGASACSDEDEPDARGSGGTSGIFGGGATGGRVEPGTGGVSGSAGSAMGTGGTGPSCSDYPASNAQPLLDDLEDADGTLVRAPRRQGFWFQATDPTNGTASPSVFEAQPGGPGSSRYAAHLSASGYTGWGVVLGFSLRHEAGGLVCPYDASAFDGLRFAAKGPGRIRLNVSMHDVVATEDGGSCQSACYDSHGSVFELSDQWEHYQILWEDLDQIGFSDPLVFDPSRLSQITFAVWAADLPIDYWIDDVTFLPAADPGSAGAGGGGAGGAAGAGGVGGAGGAGGVGGGAGAPGAAGSGGAAGSAGAPAGSAGGQP